MSNQNYTATISVDQSPKEALEAIQNVRGWWSEEIEGSTAKFGDEFKYHYRNVHTCTMKLVELVPNKRVAWLVTDNYFKLHRGQDRVERHKGCLRNREKGQRDRDPFYARRTCPRL